MRWPEGPPHLALNPPYLLFIFCCFCCFCFLCFFGGFKGQVRWPEGPPHLALSPPYLFIYLFIYFCFCFCCFCSFPFFAFNRKTLFLPLKRAFLYIFCVSLSFSLNLFWPSPFPVSLSLSLSCSCSFLSFFLVFLFLLSFGSFFFSLSNFSFFFAFVFGKEQHAMFKLQSICSSIFCLFYGFLSCFSLSNPFFLSLFFSWYSVLFFVEHQCFWFQKHKLRNTNFWSKGELQQNGFFNNLCFENVKSYRFFCPFFGHI